MINQHFYLSFYSMPCMSESLANSTVCEMALPSPLAHLPAGKADDAL